MERPLEDLDGDEYLAVQRVVYRVARAIAAALPTERMYVLSLGSQQGNAHVHWHAAPLPPGRPVPAGPCGSGSLVSEPRSARLLPVHTLVFWFGFLGAWLLVAGPVHQANVELRAEQEATARVQEVMQGAPQPPKVSSWWWLLPPVRFVLSSQRRGDSRKAFLASLPAEDFELISRYMDIARGWMLVGFGAFLIALKETYELVEHYEWATWIYWLLVVVMTWAAVSITVVGARRRQLGQRAGA